MKRKSSYLSYLISYISSFVLIILLVIGFVYRLYGLDRNHSFWSDEDHVAVFVRAIFERGRPVLRSGYSSDLYQWLQYWSGAISAKIFGLNEFALRFPSIIFGVLTIWAIFLLGKELFDKKTGLIAAVLVTFLNIEILWSRQARPYQALQFFYLLSAYFAYKAVKTEKFEKYFLGFLLSGVAASLFHGLGLIILFDSLLFIFISDFNKFKRLLFFFPAVFLLLPLYGFYSSVITTGFAKHFNFFYYRVFLRDNYFLLSLLAVLGLVLLFFKKDYQKSLLMLIFLGGQFFALAFILPQPFIRYVYVIFVFLILLAVYGGLGLASFLVERLTGWQVIRVDKKRKNSPVLRYFNFLFAFILIFDLFASLVLNGKISIFPRQIYSLNEDMKEIPEVDWKKVYGCVRIRLEENPGTILAANWMTTPAWYLGEDSLNYFIREGGSLTDIYSIERMAEVIRKEPKGIVVIDSWDLLVPKGLREFCRNNLKKEFELDRLYPVQPREWPVTVYSWGLN